MHSLSVAPEPLAVWNKELEGLESNLFEELKSSPVTASEHLSRFLAFGEFASESSMDLDNMIFSTGSTFIFGLWICEAGDDGKLQSHLLEDSDHHEDFAISTTTTNRLAGRFARLAVSDPTQISRLHASDSNSGSASETESYPSSFGKLSSFPTGLRNTTSTYQEYNSEYT